MVQILQKPFSFIFDIFFILLKLKQKYTLSYEIRQIKPYTDYFIGLPHKPPCKTQPHQDMQRTCGQGTLFVTKS